MFKHTIGDVGIQRVAQQVMFNVAGIELKKPETDDKKVPVYIDPESNEPLYPPLTGYGIIQVGITVVLVLAAIVAVAGLPTLLPTPPHLISPPLALPTTK